MKNKRVQRGIKKIFDFIVSLFIVIVFIPIWFVVAIMIKITSSGPVLFLQDRPGYHRKVFKIYKFRTMKIGSEKMVKGQEVMQGDERVTSVGKFLRRSKMDEIPQILNVLKGEMSLIGPRPERVASLADYNEEITKRLDMQPGMTGLAQVSGNIYLPLSERYKLDVYYVEHFNLWLDVKILFRTVGVVVFGEEKYLGKELIKIEKEDHEKGIDNRSK